MTVFSSHGHAQTEEYAPSDVGYVPQGFGHYIENIGDEDLKVLIVMDNGIYQDISLSDWLAKPRPTCWRITSTIRLRTGRIGRKTSG